MAKKTEHYGVYIILGVVLVLAVAFMYYGGGSFGQAVAKPSNYKDCMADAQLMKDKLVKYELKGRPASADKYIEYDTLLAQCQKLQPPVVTCPSCKECPTSQPGAFAGLSNLLIVVGDNAPGEDVVAATDVAVSFGPSIVTKNTMLASEVDDITKYNSILIGSPCYNPITNQLIGYPQDCQVSGIKLIRHSNGNIALLIMGSKSEIRQLTRKWIARVQNICADSDGSI
ncbi:Uncharacterised protein [uncultured archaeon]|nr:Uncharacterised protein [uncultured archaeon]